MDRIKATVISFAEAMIFGSVLIGAVIGFLMLVGVVSII